MREATTLDMDVPCIKCRYNLRGLSADAVCPECGLAIADSIPKPPTAVLEVNVPCIKCRYNLRGLRGDAVCPECGMAIADSIQQDFLCFADGRWLAELRRGAVIAMVGMLLMPLLPMVAAMLLAAMPRPPDRAWLLVPAMLVASSLVACMGWWKLSQHDPKRMSGVNSLGVYVRGASALFVVGVIAVSALAYLSMNRRGGNDASIFLTVCLMWLAGFVWAIAGTMLINSLFIRMPDEMGASAAMSVLLGAFLLNSIGVMILVGPPVFILLQALLLNRLRRALFEIERSRGEAGER